MSQERVFEKEISKTYKIRYHFMPMKNGERAINVFLQHYINFDNGVESFWVGDGDFNKKEYENYRTTRKAFTQAIGKQVLDGFHPDNEDTNFTKYL